MKNEVRNSKGEGRWTAWLWLAVCLLTSHFSLLPSPAANVRLYFVKPFSTDLDTNAMITWQISSNVLANGGVQPQGLPKRVIPGTNGLATNFFGIGWYAVSNVVNSHTPIVINVYDGTTALYDYTNLLQSGFNTYAVTVYGTNPPPTFAEITNGLGFLPLTPAQTTNVATNAIGTATNTVFGWLGSAAFVSTNSFYRTNQPLQAGSTALTNFATFGTNFFYPRSNPSNFVTATVTNGLATSNQMVSATNTVFGWLGSAAFVSTNFFYRTNQPLQAGSTALTNFATFGTNFFYPRSNPSNFVTATVTNGLATINQVLAVSNNVAGGKIDSTNGVAYISFTAQGNVTVSTNLTVTNNLAVLGSSTHAGTTAFGAGSESFFTEDGSVEFVNGNFTIGSSGDVLVSQNFTVSGTALFGDTVTVGNDIIIQNLDSDRALYLDSDSKVRTSATTATELGYVNGLTGPVQPQLNSKLAATNATAVGLTMSFPFTNGTWVNLTNTSGTWVITNRGSANRVQILTNGSLSVSRDIAASGTLSILSDSAIGGNEFITSNLNVGGNITPANLTGSRLLVSDASKRITNSTASATEAAFLVGVTGGIQTNINRRVADTNGNATNLNLYGPATFNGAIAVPNFSANRVLITDAGAVDQSSVTPTELLNIAGGTGLFQTNIDNRIRSTNGIATNAFTVKGNAFVYTNLYTSSIFNTNAFTSGGPIYLSANFFGGATNFGNYGFFTNDLRLGGIFYATNARLANPFATNTSLIGTNYILGSVSELSTNLYAVANGVNEIAPGEAVVVYIRDSLGSPTAAYSLCGITAPRTDKKLIIYNITTNIMTVVNDSGSIATAANRIRINADTQIATNGFVEARYSTTESRWIIQPNSLVSSGSGSATNAINNFGGGGTNTTLYGVTLVSNASFGTWTVYTNAGTDELDFDNTGGAHIQFANDGQIAINGDFTTSAQINGNSLHITDPSTLEGPVFLDGANTIGFQQSAGDINVTLNSGDFHVDNTISAVADITTEGNFIGHTVGLNFDSPFSQTKTNAPVFNFPIENSVSGGYNGKRMTVTISLELTAPSGGGAGFVILIEDAGNHFTNRLNWGLGALTALARKDTNTISFQINPNATFTIQTNGAAGSVFAISPGGFNASSQ